MPLINIWAGRRSSLESRQRPSSNLGRIQGVLHMLQLQQQDVRGANPQGDPISLWVALAPADWLQGQERVGPVSQQDWGTSVLQALMPDRSPQGRCLATPTEAGAQHSLHYLVRVFYQWLHLSTSLWPGSTSHLLPDSKGPEDRASGQSWHSRAAVIYG